MIYLGINALEHDASVSIVDSESREILFAAHSERFSGIKNDPDLCDGILGVAKSYGVDRVFWHGKPLLKLSRQIYSGEVFRLNNVTQRILPSAYLSAKGIEAPITYINHHESHAAAGFYTSTFDEACVVVIDAIGEWDTLSIWSANKETGLKRLKTLRYPGSLGLLYSAFTKRVGLKPNEEEYILMGMSAYGDPERYYRQIRERFISDSHSQLPVVSENCHLGIGEFLPNAGEYDLAAGVQRVTEEYVRDVMAYARRISGHSNLVYQGGVALNCVANKYAYEVFDEVWVMPNPGDSGGSLGAIAANLGPIRWRGPYLGYEIPGDYPVKELADALIERKIMGVACGRAEFGPRAFGNRSLLADPRGADIKDRVNEIKNRQRFRPFAPVILEELVSEYFDVPSSYLPYMQLTVKCRREKEFPAIAHHDGTSRVQTVSNSDHPGLYNLLLEFYKRTGCPMLLNTSLNIKGQPLVNTELDASNFSRHYGITVLTGR